LRVIKNGSTGLNLAVFRTFAEFMFPEVLTRDRAVQIYKNSHTLKITFSVSKYSSRSFGELVKKLRLERKLSQKELAEKIGVNEMSVVGGERNLRSPTARSVAKLTRFFKHQGRMILEMLSKTTPWHITHCAIEFEIRIPPFHGGDTSSNLVGDAFFIQIPPEANL